MSPSASHPHFMGVTANNRKELEAARAEIGDNCGADAGSRALDDD